MKEVFRAFDGLKIMNEEKPKDQEKSKAKAAEGEGKKAEAKKAETKKGETSKGDKAAKAEAKAEGKSEAKGQKSGKGKAPVEGKAAEKEGGKGLVERPLDGYVPRMLTTYKNSIVPTLRKRFSYKNVMQVPRLDRIVVNMGVGEAVEDQKHLDHAIEDMQTITGQKPAVRRAKKSISNFKLRQGMPVGCMVTLRRWRMYEFLDRFISLAVPRVRDFRGLPDNAFDGRGNYSLGIKEQIIFPEINYDRVSKIRGMNITFVTTANTDEEAYELLAAFGMPFRKR
jgi:large subunit ribosomal protein L5